MPNTIYGAIDPETGDVVVDVHSIRELGMSLKAKGFIVLVEDQFDGRYPGQPQEFDSFEEAQEEAIRLFIKSGKSQRAIVYASMAVIGPKLDKDTDFKLSKMALRLLPADHPARVAQEAQEEVNKLLSKENGGTREEGT